MPVGTKYLKYDAKKPHMPTLYYAVVCKSIKILKQIKRTFRSMTFQI